VTHQTVNIRLPPELHRHVAALVAEGILGRTIEEVVIHLTRNALHRDWVPRPAPLEKPRPSEPKPSPSGSPTRISPSPEAGIPPSKQLLRLRDVSRMVGLGRSSIYRLVSLGTFPAPKKLGARSVAWLQSEVESWIDARDVAP
jgi:prophage regulatory protein